MHHPDPEGDSGGSIGKMAMFPRTGSIGPGGIGSGPVATLSTQAANAVVNNVNNSHVPAVDDYQSSLLFQSQTPAGSSSPGPQQQHPPPPQSLNLLPPSCAQTAGVQMKKKSGFQITSVTPAQISVSTNNSIAEDTESYDDLDESHTEDLSSSEILDVSLSRANDIGGADRSSSEETLNNFHEAETPGAMSPNQPSHPHALNQVSQHGGTLVNGTVHHLHYQHQQPYHHPQGQHHIPQAQRHPGSSGHGVAPAALPSGAIHSVAQKMPSNLGAGKENISVGPLNVTAQPAGALAPGSVPGMHSAATGTTISIVNPLTSNVSNVNMLSSANVPMKGAVGTSASSGSGGVPPSVISRSGVGGSVAMGVALTSNPKVNSGITAAASASGVMGPSGGTQGGVGSALTHPGGPSAPSVPPNPISSTSSQPAPAPTTTTTTTTTTTSSRFRVVKLDSSSEPFKKGRWLCTEYYDKVESTPNVPTSLSSEAACPPPGPRPGESVRQFTHETFVGGSGRESTSGGSVSSTVSTLSHYTESVGSGEAGGGTVVHQQQPQEYAPAPQGFQAQLASGLSMGVSHSQPHMHGQTTMAPSAPGSIHHQPVLMTGHQTTVGYPLPGVAPQQLTYAQAVASPPPDTTHGLVGVQHQQQQQQQHMGYTSLPQQPCATSQAAQVQVRPPEYTHAHPGVPQPAASQQTLSHQAGMMPAGPGSGAGHMMAAPQQQAVNSMPSQQQQPHVLLQAHPQQISSLQGTTSAMVPQMGVAGLSQPLPSHSVALDQQQSLQAQIQSGPVHQVAAPPNTPSDPQAQAHNGANSGGMGIAPQSVGQLQLPPHLSMAQDFASAHVHTQTAQTAALYANLPNFTTTQLVDAQRLLLQHQSALLGLPIISGGGAIQGHGAEGSAAAVSALTTTAGFLKTVDGEEDSSSGASVVAIDNKIEQAMDLVKSHLMYAVREEVEVLKEQIKELIERNSQLEQENTLLKTLASPEQMAQFQAQVQTTSSPPAATGAAVLPVGPGGGGGAPQLGALPPAATAPLQQQPVSHSSGASA